MCLWRLLLICNSFSNRDGKFCVALPWTFLSDSANGGTKKEPPLNERLGTRRGHACAFAQSQQDAVTVFELVDAAAVDYCLARGARFPSQVCGPPAWSPTPSPPGKDRAQTGCLERARQSRSQYETHPVPLSGPSSATGVRKETHPLP